ncbi:hypothetical protein [Chryseosolibacter indicus]|uniref:Auto-transporter adhesin head GIN domain-containing protein n=1 Tax=Chryseosolibacter indicus TaxID=2782351 RepID=A0ABS5VTX9_9BACT|nr:hypothetical protein [Chryseosolibacter indicus]MBT1704224.1 hypothetical protein [Chryseosolibacter indicus]
MKNLLFAIVMLSFFSLAFGQNGEFHLDKEYSINKTGMLDLAASDAKVFITGSDRTSAHIRINRKIEAKGWTKGGENFKVEVEESEGNIKVREKNNFYKYFFWLLS